MESNHPARTRRATPVVKSRAGCGGERNQPTGSENLGYPRAIELRSGDCRRLEFTDRTRTTAARSPHEGPDVVPNASRVAFGGTRRSGATL